MRIPDDDSPYNRTLMTLAATSVEIVVYFAATATNYVGSPDAVRKAFTDANGATEGLVVTEQHGTYRVRVPGADAELTEMQWASVVEFLRREETM
jgi:hypothetical protein